MDEINSALLALREQKVGQILLTLSLLTHSSPPHTSSPTPNKTYPNKEKNERLISGIPCPPPSFYI